MKPAITCPRVSHFHIVFEQVGSLSRPSRTIEASSPLEALELFLPSLPASWRGGVSVFDDSNGNEDEMPLAHTTLQWSK
jgi:hypothetical protein